MYLLILLVGCFVQEAIQVQPEQLEYQMHRVEESISTLRTLRGQMTGAYTRGELLRVMQRINVEEGFCRDRIVGYNDLRRRATSVNPEKFPADLDPRICIERDVTLPKQENSASE